MWADRQYLCVWYDRKGKGRFKRENKYVRLTDRQIDRQKGRHRERKRKRERETETERDREREREEERERKRDEIERDRV